MEILFLNKDKKMIYPTQVVTRGFMVPNLSQEFCGFLKQKANEVLANALRQYKNINVKYIERQVGIVLSQDIYHKTERKPLIVTTVNIINK